MRKKEEEELLNNGGSEVFFRYVFPPVLVSLVMAAVLVFFPLEWRLLLLEGVQLGAVFGAIT